MSPLLLYRCPPKIPGPRTDSPAVLQDEPGVRSLRRIRSRRIRPRIHGNRHHLRDWNRTREHLRRHITHDAKDPRCILREDPASQRACLANPRDRPHRLVRGDIRMNLAGGCGQGIGRERRVERVLDPVTREIRERGAIGILCRRSPRKRDDTVAGEIAREREWQGTRGRYRNGRVRATAGFGTRPTRMTAGCTGCSRRQGWIRRPADGGRNRLRALRDGWCESDRVLRECETGEREPRDK